MTLIRTVIAIKYDVEDKIFTVDTENTSSGEGANDVVVQAKHREIKNYNDVKYLLDEFENEFSK